MGGTLGNRADDVNQYHKYEKKWKRDLKDLKKHSKMLYSIDKRLVSRLECKNIKKI